jgi:hypothetical protein
MTFRVYFNTIERNNLLVKLEDKKQIFSFIASSILYNSISELADGLISILTYENIEAYVHWNTEPVEYDFHFSVNFKNVSFRVLEYPDRKRKSNSGKLVFSKDGSSSEVALPFWRALRQMGSLEKEPNYSNFNISPERMNQLTKTIKKN